MANQIELYRRQLRWEPLKALAALVAAAAVFMGGVLAVANWWLPMPQVIMVYVEGVQIALQPSAKP